MSIGQLLVFQWSHFDQWMCTASIGATPAKIEQNIEWKFAPIREPTSCGMPPLQNANAG
jgi:hypothetical protein